MKLGKLKKVGLCKQQQIQKHVFKTMATEKLKLIQPPTRILREKAEQCRTIFSI